MILFGGACRTSPVGTPLASAARNDATRERGEMPPKYQGEGTKADLDNHSNQLNPNHPQFGGGGGGSSAAKPGAPKP